MYNVREKVLLPSKHKTFVWHLYNVGPACSTLVQHCIKSYKCVVFTRCRYTRGVNLFRNTHSNTVSLFAKQGPAKIQDKGLWDSMELLLINVTQVDMNLLWFENLLLMRLWVWNAYLVLLWNRALAYPRALLHSGGPLSREFWQLTLPLNYWYWVWNECLNIKICKCSVSN